MRFLTDLGYSSIMRRFLFPFITLIAASSCSDNVLAPVQTVDGTWKGTQNGFALSLAMTQTGTTISSCGVAFGSNGGAVSGTCTGTFNFPTFHATINVTGFQPLTYDATMSTAEAKLSGTLNGSGLDHVGMDIRKQ